MSNFLGEDLFFFAEIKIVIHPGKSTWNPTMEVWVVQMIFVFNWVNFIFHVNFEGRKGFEQ